MNSRRNDSIEDQEALIPLHAELFSGQTYSTFDMPDPAQFAQSPSYWAWLPSWDSLYNWLPSRYTLLNAFFSVTTAIPYLPYTVQLFTGTHPKDFSMEWWNDLPLSEQALTASMTLFTFVISVIVHYRYFPDTAKRLLEIFSDWTGRITTNSLTIFLTIATMISSYGIGYDGMIQAGVLLAVLSGVFNAGLYGAFRLAFVPAFINRMTNYFDQDEAFKNECIHYVNQLKSLDILDRDDITLDDKAIFSLFMQLDQEFKKGYRSELFNQPLLPANRKNYPGLLFDIGMGSTLFLSYCLYNIQTGYRGMEVICKLISEQCSVDTLSQLSKIVIGLASGLSSGMVSFVMGFDMRQLFQSIYHYLKDHPQHLTINVALLTGIILSSIADIGPIVSPAYNIASDPANLIFISMDNPTGPLFIAYAALFSFLLDLSAMAALSFKNEKPDAAMIEKQEVIEWVKTNPKSGKMMRELKNLGVFSVNRNLALVLPEENSVYSRLNV